MQTLIQKLKKSKRKRRHVYLLQDRIAELNHEIVSASFKSEYSYNKNITVVRGNIENKAKLLKKYNRRLKLIIY
jgi:hypothetical protein